MNRGTNRGFRITALGSWWMVALMCVSSLVAEGSDTRLIEAVRQGDRETLRLLLKEPVDVNVPQGDGTTALHWAAHRNDLEAAELLIGTGPTGTRPTTMASLLSRWPAPMGMRPWSRSC